MTARPPAVAGLFYPGETGALRRTVETLLGEKVQTKIKARGVVVPHAGYVYSGATAAAVYRLIEIPRRVVIVGPNHTGLGDPIAVMGEGEWAYPGGHVPLDAGLAAALKAEVGAVRFDDRAHRGEHSLEVQVPFLHAMRPDASILPVVLKHLPYRDADALAQGLAKAIRKTGDEVLIVASSDMTHFESRERAEKQDRLAIDRIIAMDPEGLYRTVEDHGITMCGYIPAVVMLAAALAMGATRAELVAYATSGDVTRDDTSVVGYAGITII